MSNSATRAPDIAARCLHRILTASLRSAWNAAGPAAFHAILPWPSPTCLVKCALTAKTRSCLTGTHGRAFIVTSSMERDSDARYMRSRRVEARAVRTERSGFRGQTR